MSFALYIHWPFCLKKCPYCDFHSRVSASIDQEHWRNLLLAQLDFFALETPGRTLGSIFFGGGTPSLMPPETISALIARAREYWPFAPNIEISLEANPGELNRLEQIKDCGINRISLGIQALNDKDLKLLGRRHDLETAHKAIDQALKLFSRVSIDLIYARPQQSPKAWQAELQEALNLGPTHFSLYQLTISPGTSFALQNIKAMNENDAALFYQITQEECDKKGFPAYEISNHARAKDECRHNLIYWQNGEYIGIGPTAHGRHSKDGKFFASECLMNEKIPQIEEISPKEKAWERILMGLRLSSGINIDEIKDFLSWPNINQLEKDGLIYFNNDVLTVGPKGRICLNLIIEKILL